MIYADANGTYPVAPSHYDEVAALLKQVDGNPSSIHALGRNAKVALEQARDNLAQMLGARSPEVIFTSGATEANNLALQGAVGRVWGASGGEGGGWTRVGQVLPHVIVTAAEHSSVIEAAQALALRGLCRLDLAPVTRAGEVDGEMLLEMIAPDTVCVAIMHANNETGAISPVGELAARIKAINAATHVHVDGVQMLGKADLRWYGKGPIDSAAFSAHKLGAFKGVGALYLKAGVKLAPLAIGGGQERGRRPGTENMPGIVSFGLRCAEVRGQEAAIAAHMRQLRDAWIEVLSRVDGAQVHGGPGAGESLPNTVNFHIEGVSGDDLLLNFDLAGIHASSGSACSSSVARPSHVLLAMGYSEWVALNSVRVSFGPGGSLADVAAMERVLGEVMARVRR